jgi:hypothetical protein
MSATVGWLRNVLEGLPEETEIRTAVFEGRNITHRVDLFGVRRIHMAGLPGHPAADLVTIELIGLEATAEDTKTVSGSG